MSLSTRTKTILTVAMADENAATELSTAVDTAGQASGSTAGSEMTLPAHASLTGADVGKMVYLDGGEVKVYTPVGAVPVASNSVITLTQNVPSTPGVDEIFAAQANKIVSVDKTGGDTSLEYPHALHILIPSYNVSPLVIEFVALVDEPTPYVSGLYIQVKNQGPNGNNKDGLVAIRNAIETMISVDPTLGTYITTAAVVDDGSRANLVLTAGSALPDADGNEILLSAVGPGNITFPNGAQFDNGTAGVAGVTGSQHDFGDGQFGAITINCSASPAPVSAHRLDYLPGANGTADAQNIKAAFEAYLADREGAVPGITASFSISILGNVLTIERNDSSYPITAPNTIFNNVPVANTFNFVQGASFSLGNPAGRLLGQLKSLSASDAIVDTGRIFTVKAYDAISQGALVGVFEGEIHPTAYPTTNQSIYSLTTTSAGDDAIVSIG